MQFCLQRITKTSSSNNSSISGSSSNSSTVVVVDVIRYTSIIHIGVIAINNHDNDNKIATSYSNTSIS